MSRKSVSLPLPFPLATAAEDSAATMPEHCYAYDGTIPQIGPLNYKRLNTK